MNGCDEQGINVLPYLDNELSGGELKDFRSHLTHCSDCQLKLAEEEALSRMLRRAYPFDAAPESLHARIAVLTAEQSADPPGRRFYRFLMRSFSPAAQPVLHWKAFTAMALVIALGLGFVPSMMQQARAMAYVDTAVTTHRSYLSGNLPLEIRTASPEKVTGWFAGKLPFHFQLPASPTEPNGTTPYQLSGARLVNFDGSYAALVTYRMRDEKISLLVASNKAAISAGGEEVTFGGLIFHHSRRAGFTVTTWSNHGLTYALVSSVHVPAQQSCLVCHQNMADKDKFGQP